MQPVNKLGRSDFLPVGEEKEGEQLERGCSSFLWQAPYAYYGHGMFGESGNFALPRLQKQADPHASRV